MPTNTLTPDSAIHSAPDQPRSLIQSSRWLWVAPLVFISLVSVYFVLRYNGNWAENDSANFATYIGRFLQEGRISTDGDVYPNGYGFQAISAFIVTLTGLDVATLQQIIYPLLVPLTVIPAWLLYRELTDSPFGATIGTLLLFTQPEFLFVMLRSSHEKFTRTLLFLCLYWLVRSFKLQRQPGLFATHVVLFYLTVYAMIANNNLISNSFIFSIVAALSFGWLLSRFRPHLRSLGQSVIYRLIYTTSICVGLVFLFTFYAYPPAVHDIQVLRSIWERTAALFLDVQKNAASAQAYTQLNSAWVSLPIYFMVSIANWLMLAISFIICLRQGWRWVIRNETPPSRTAWFMWLLYVTFALQGAISVLADASGYIGNLQVRIFPSFSTIGVGLIASALINWRLPTGQIVRPVQLGLAILIFCLAIFSVCKATNEPLLSNKWVFYREEEMAALVWSDHSLHDTDIWTEYDERLLSAFQTTHGDTNNNNRLAAFNVRPAIRAMLMSDVTRLRLIRLGLASPVPPDAWQIYDNGLAQVYRLRSSLTGQ